MWNLNEIEWIDFEITSFCNIKCPGCLRQQSEIVKPLLNKEYLKLDDLKKWIRRIDFPSIKIVNFCGSVDEPTSHPEFLEIIKYFKTWNCHINIATNGSIRTKKWWKNLGILLKDHPHSVHFGIDGLDGLSHRYRVNSNYEKVKENWRSFISEEGRAIWQFIVFEWNEHQLEDARKFSVDEGFEGFRTIFSHRNTSGEKKVNREALDNIECKYGNQKRIFINHLGNVIPCCHLNSETLEVLSSNRIKTNFGELYVNNGKQLSTNLRYQHINDILNGDLFNDIIRSWSTQNPIKKCYDTCKQKKHDLFEDIKND